MDRARTRPRNRRRTRQFFSFPPFSHPASPMTIKGWVFVAIVEGKLEMGMGLGQVQGQVRVLGLGLGQGQGQGKVRVRVRAGAHLFNGLLVRVRRVRVRLGVFFVAYILLLFICLLIIFINLFFCLEKYQKSPNWSLGSSPGSKSWLESQLESLRDSCLGFFQRQQG